MLVFGAFVFPVRLRRGERELGDTAQDVSFLRRELALKAIGIDDLLALVGRHGPQITNRRLHHLPPFRGQALDLLKKLARMVLLFGSEVLPGFHAIKNPLLLLGRQVVKTLQPFAQALLTLRRKIAELGIIFQGLLLLVGREIAIASQPVSSVVARVLLRLAISPLFLALLPTPLSPAGRG